MKTLHILRKLFEWFGYLLGSDGGIRREDVDAGLLDMSGQGRDRYGR